MNIEKENLKTSVGEMHKRRETMADGRRYIIYYTFEKSEEKPSEIETQNTGEVKENV